MKHLSQLAVTAGLIGALVACDRGGPHSEISTRAELAKPVAKGECVPFDRVLKGVIEPKCKMCHGDGSPNKNWTDHKMASQFGANIVDKITGSPPKMGGAKMPMAGSLSEEEKNLLVSWVDGGSKQTCGSGTNDNSPAPVPAQAPATPAVDAPVLVAAACVACHGANGNGVGPSFPNLAGQSLAYLEKQLRDFRSRDRSDPVMSGVAQSLKDTEITELAKHFNSIGAARTNESKTETSAKSKATPPEVVSSCLACHGAAGIADDSVMPNVPNLAGQKADYISKQLSAFKSQTRRDPIMQGMAAALTDEQIQAIAKYFSEL